MGKTYRKSEQQPKGKVKQLTKRQRERVESYLIKITPKQIR